MDLGNAINFFFTSHFNPRDLGDKSLKKKKKYSLTDPAS